MKVLMVCLGNICRSPMAEGILRNMAAGYKINLHIDSAGTGSWHVGESPDSRAIHLCRKNGIDISKLRARQFSKNDFKEFDIILAMDRTNFQDILHLAKGSNEAQKVSLLLEHGSSSMKDVPDPYYGDEKEFEEVFKLLETTLESFVNNSFNKQ